MTAAEYNNCVGNFSDNVFRFIFKNIKHKDDSEDIVQNAFEILWKNHRDVPFEKAKAYLFQVAYNNMIDNIRKNKRMNYSAHLNENGLFANSGYTGGADALNSGLGKLPEVQRSVVMLRDYEGYSYDEIAEIADLSVTQVKVYIFRARKALQKYLIRIDNVI